MTVLVNQQPVSYSNLALILESRTPLILPSMKKISYDWSRNPESCYGTDVDPYGKTVGQNQYSNVVFDVSMADYIVFRSVLCRQFNVSESDYGLKDPSVEFDMSLSFRVAAVRAVEQEWFNQCSFVKKSISPSSGPSEVIVSVEIKPLTFGASAQQGLQGASGLGSGLQGGRFGF